MGTFLSNHNPPISFFPLSVLPLHGLRACAIAEVWNQADNLKPQHSGWMKEKGCPRELESTEIYCLSSRLIIRWYNVGQIPIEWQMLWKLNWYWNCVHRSHVRTCSLNLIHVDHLLRQKSSTKYLQIEFYYSWKQWCIMVKNLTKALQLTSCFMMRSWMLFSWMRTR